MLGGGFLGQMHETTKRNREMVSAALGKNKRVPFDKSNVSNSGRGEELVDGPRLTEFERQKLIEKVITEEKKETRRKIAILVTLVIILYAGLKLLGV